MFAVLAGIALAPGSSTALGDTVTLGYQETSQPVISWSLSVTTQTTPFKHEPSLPDAGLVRGVLNFGAGTSNAIPFLWQRHAGKLFLDLNRNQDLTDDPAGILSARLTAPLSYQTFTNVHLAFTTARGRLPVLADLNFWDYGNRPGGSLSVRTFWQGKLTLPGQDWQVGVLPAIWVGENGNRNISIENHLLLRPWENRNQTVNAYGGSLDTVVFSSKLFLGGHAYRLNLQPSSSESEIKPVLDFLEQPVTLGDLKITGKYIKRMVLPGEPWLVVLDHPAGTVKVPVGAYKQPSALLDQGGVAASCSPDSSASARRVVVSVNEKSPAALDIGGPLTNSVAVERHGEDLLLNYHLIGAGGATYQMINQNRSQPPEFAVYRGDKQIASGKFEFG